MFVLVTEVLILEDPKIKTVGAVVLCEYKSKIDVLEH